MKRILFTALVCVAMCGCCSNSMEGSWIETGEYQQGMTLEKGGKASSINMATLLYENWKKEGGKLILSGKSVGNGQTIMFSDTLQIKQLTADSLIVARGECEIKYSKKP